MTDRPRPHVPARHLPPHPIVSRRMLLGGVATTALAAAGCGTDRNPFTASTLDQLTSEPILARRPGETELVYKEVTKGSAQFGVRQQGPAVERVSASNRDLKTVVDEIYQQYAARYNLKRADLTRPGAAVPVVVELRGTSAPDRAVVIVASTETFNPTVANRDELGRIPAGTKTIVDVAVTLKQPKKKTER